ncbi:hypothetical protein [Candidatus Colwellia aromaticivorans]|uniref:hypothetical protein n=1 Tax=Candidatus Colwellia aromaticivorans TaxID=2267621 RepID=UPI000DF458FB|nr:hypothetical protein [Candidatus Colwellia aromaticivorans]
MKSNQQNKPAIIYQSLYLSNLLLVPIVSFILLVFYLYQDKPLSNFSKIHLIRSIQISALAGLFLGVAPIFYIIYSKEYDASVMITIFYFVTLHTGFVLIGMLNLTRAMSRKLPLF